MIYESVCPFRIAIIGSGPSGFYTADYLLNQNDFPVSVDMFDRLPTPFGLIRSGVAPDHQKTKRVSDYYHKIAVHPRFRFFGNVEYGMDIQRNDLLSRYHQVVYAVGAPDDRKLGITGEHLDGCYSARDFVGWYNAHPDYSSMQFDFTRSPVLIIGNGNVALDIVRILCLSEEELATTDIADHSLAQLSNHRVREIHVLGRKDPFHASFTLPVFERLAEMQNVSFEINPPDILDQKPTSDHHRRLMEIMLDMQSNPHNAGSTKIIFHFLVSPVSIIGEESVEGIRIRHLSSAPAGNGITHIPGAVETDLPAGVIIRAVGYRGAPLRGIPFDEEKGVIPNKLGRISFPGGETFITGEYVSGWIKRGPFGSIPHIRQDAQETAISMTDDLRAGRFNQPAGNEGEPTVQWLSSIKNDYVFYEDWMKIDTHEKKLGQELGRPRVKFTSIQSMLDIIGDG